MHALFLFLIYTFIVILVGPAYRADFVLKDSDEMMSVGFRPRFWTSLFLLAYGYRCLSSRTCG